jgi:hypothetical protein
MALPSVSNPVITDTGILVFGTPNTDTNKNLPAFAGIENQNYFLLKKILGNIRLIYCFYLQTGFRMFANKTKNLSNPYPQALYYRVILLPFVLQARSPKLYRFITLQKSPRKFMY